MKLLAILALLTLPVIASADDCDRVNGSNRDNSDQTQRPVNSCENANGDAVTPNADGTCPDGSTRPV